MGRHNRREVSNTYETERQRELDKLRRELIKPKYTTRDNKSNSQNYKKKKFVKNQK